MLAFVCTAPDLSLICGERHGYYYNQVNVTQVVILKNTRYRRETGRERESKRFSLYASTSYRARGDNSFKYCK